jgi:hypothetical protein
MKSETGSKTTWHYIWQHCCGWQNDCDDLIPPNGTDIDAAGLHEEGICSAQMDTPSLSSCLLMKSIEGSAVDSVAKNE